MQEGHHVFARHWVMALLEILFNVFKFSFLHRSDAEIQDQKYAVLSKIGDS